MIEVQDLTVEYRVDKQRLAAVDHVSFSVSQGQVFGIVGESGSGKSTLGKAIARLVPASDGKVLLNGRDLLKLDRRSVKEMRKEVQIVFQDPGAALNAKMLVRDLIEEPLVIHGGLTRTSRAARVETLMDEVGLDPELSGRFPTELSGGQRQRVAIARALILQPTILIADEPTSALDVSIQSQIINLLDRLRLEMGLTLIFISHDLAVVRSIADQVGVMYLGALIEQGNTASMYSTPRHPYTLGILEAAPTMRRRTVPRGIAGEIPSALNLPTGCRFASRCPQAQALCRESEPPLTGDPATGGRVACHFPLA